MGVLLEGGQGTDEQDGPEENGKENQTFSQIARKIAFPSHGTAWATKYVLLLTGSAGAFLWELKAHRMT